MIGYAFSVPATPFVARVNRATSETMRMQATQEELAPLKAWIKCALEHAIQVCTAEPGLGKYNQNHDEAGRFATAGAPSVPPMLRCRL